VHLYYCVSVVTTRTYSFILDFIQSFLADTLRIVFTIKCPKDRLAKVVIGHGGSHINQIKIDMEKDLAKLLQKTIDLHISVVVEEKAKKVSSGL